MLYRIVLCTKYLNEEDWEAEELIFETTEFDVAEKKLIQISNESKASGTYSSVQDILNDEFICIDQRVGMPNLQYSIDSLV